MNRTIVVFGAQTSLGALVARQYGNDGYDVVLVATQAHALGALITVLESEGTYATSVISELATPEQAAALVRSIRYSTGPIEAVFYGAAEAMPGEVNADQVDLTMAAIFNEVLPEMRARKVGALLVSPVGVPALKGAMQHTTCRYLQGLQGAMADDGVHIGFLSAGSLFCRETRLTAQTKNPAALRGKGVPA